MNLAMFAPKPKHSERLSQENCKVDDEQALAVDQVGLFTLGVPTLTYIESLLLFLSSRASLPHPNSLRFHCCTDVARSLIVCIDLQLELEFQGVVAQVSDLVRTNESLIHKSTEVSVEHWSIYIYLSTLMDCTELQILSLH
jgi:hypothetical protein